jgi:hypothetical protein
MTKEFIKADLDRVDEDGLETSTLMDRLVKIKIDGPEDFASHFDLYLNGEKVPKRASETGSN